MKIVNKFPTYGVVLFFACCLLTFTMSCKEDATPPFVLPAELYTIEKVYDVGNNNNAADIRVEVKTSSLITSDLIDVRLVIVKATKIFTVDQIDGLTTGNYHNVPISDASKQVIKSVGTVKDSDGDPITSGIYKLYIAVLGKQDSKQLSGAKEITLQNRPIYAGDYLGTWEDLGPPGPGSFPITLRVSDTYECQMFYTSNFTPYGRGPGLQDVTATLTVSGLNFGFLADQFIDKYTGGGAFTTGSGGGCPASQNLSGTINDDVTLVFETFTWSDCDGTREVKMRFTKL